jgi:hypothetical protein
MSAELVTAAKSLKLLIATNARSRTGFGIDPGSMRGGFEVEVVTLGHCIPRGLCRCRGLNNGRTADESENDVASYETQLSTTPAHIPAQQVL